MSDSGATISMKDPRVSRVINWIWACLGAGFLWIASRATSYISEMSINVAKMTVQIEGLNRRLDVKDARDDKQDVSISDLQQDVSVLEGRNLRGGSRGN